MFAPILANFLHIIFIIFGLFGAYQFRGKYLASVSFTLSLVWFLFFMAFGKESNFCAKNSIWNAKCKISFMLCTHEKYGCHTGDDIRDCFIMRRRVDNIFFIFNSVNSIIVNIGYSMPKYKRSTAVISTSKKWFHCFYDLSLTFILSMSKIKQQKNKLQCSWYQSEFFIALSSVKTVSIFTSHIRARIHSVYLSIKHERVDRIFDFGTAIKSLQHECNDL